MDMKKSIFITLMVMVVVSVRTLDDDGLVQMTSELELVRWDLEDECSDIARTLKNYLQGRANGLSNKIEEEVDHGTFLRKQADRLSKYSEDVPYELARNLTFYTKCGDALLPEKEYREIIEFANKNIELGRTAKITCLNGGEDCTMNKQDVLNLLSTSRNETELRDTWSKWNMNYVSNQGEYPAVLKLVSKASELNGLYDGKSYWEMLAEINEAYSKSESLWNEVEPLYQKLHNFVLIRLNKYYNTNYTEIPVYLLGSPFGDDWSNIADIILPHPQIYHDIKVDINATNPKQLYKLAENFTRSMGLPSLGNAFWTNSDFNDKNCGPETLNYCLEKHSQIITCDSSTVQAYTKAHAAVIEMATNKRDFLSYPLRKLRQSAVTDGLGELGALYSLNNLGYYGMLPDNAFSKEPEGPINRKTMLLLVALRVLPQMAFYHAVDAWRLQELEFPSDNAMGSWWEIRKKYQGIQGITSEEPDFLQDEYVLYNKPYISKFLGSFVPFQLLTYHQINFFQDSSNLMKTFKEDTSFREMLDNTLARDPLDLLSYYYGIDDISVYPLMDFFSQLEEYFEEAPEDQAPFTVKTPKNRPTEPPKIKTKKPKIKPVTTTTTLAPTGAQNDQADVTTIAAIIKTVDDGKIGKSAPVAEVTHAGTYVGIGIVAATLGGIIGLLVWKKMKRRKPVTGNRRFADA